MNNGLTANASTSIKAPVEQVWDALVDPDKIKKYMFGTEVTSDWREGAPIVWKGEWQGKPYEDKGKIIKIKPEATLQYTHYSATSGLPDTPENYHTVTYKLWRGNEGTDVLLSQDNNKDAKEVEHSRAMWQKMLGELKKVVEAGN